MASSLVSKTKGQLVEHNELLQQAIENAKMKGRKVISIFANKGMGAANEVSIWDSETQHRLLQEGGLPAF